MQKNTVLDRANHQSVSRSIVNQSSSPTVSELSAVNVASPRGLFVAAAAGSRTHARTHTRAHTRTHTHSRTSRKRKMYAREAGCCRTWRPRGCTAHQAQTRWCVGGHTQRPEVATVVLVWPRRANTSPAALVRTTSSSQPCGRLPSVAHSRPQTSLCHFF